MRGTSTAVEADQPGKLFVGGLSVQTDEKALKALFGKFGPLTEVLLIKDRETSQSRGFAFVTFHSPEDAADAKKHTNEKSLDGKTIKVEQAYKPSFQSGGRQWLPRTSSNRGGGGSLQSGRAASGEAREHPSGGTHLDDGGSGLNLNVSSSRGHRPHQRYPRAQSADPLPQMSASSGSRRRSPGMGRRVSRERDSNGGAPCSEPVYSRKGGYMSSREDACPIKYRYSRRDYLSSPDSRRDRDCGYKGSWDERCHRGYSSHRGYGGHPDRATSDCGNGGSYRDSCKRYGRWRAAPPAGRPSLTSCGRRDYSDHCRSWQTDYERGRENYLNTGRGSWSRRHERGGRRDRGFSPPVWQDIPVLRESSRSSKKGALPMDSWGS